MLRKYIVAGVMSLTVLSAGITGCDTGADTVGPRGGTVISDDGRFVLDIPEGALEHEVDITITRVDCADIDAVAPCYHVEPMGTGFLRPALVEFELGGMELGENDMMRLGFLVERDTGWNVLADREVDMGNEVVSGSALYLSEFAVAPVE